MRHRRAEGQQARPGSRISGSTYIPVLDGPEMQAGVHRVAVARARQGTQRVAAVDVSPTVDRGDTGS